MGRQKVYDKEENFAGLRLNAKGQEVPDPTPVELPLGYEHPMSLEDRLASLIKNELANRELINGMESFNEANDFSDEDEDKFMYPDEDDEFAVNDPYVKRASKSEEVKKAFEGIKKYQEEKAAAERAQPPAKPAE